MQERGIAPLYRANLFNYKENPVTTYNGWYDGIQKQQAWWHFFNPISTDDERSFLLETGIFCGIQEGWNTIVLFLQICCVERWIFYFIPKSDRETLGLIIIGLMF